jgi:hypothetical protein
MLTRDQNELLTRVEGDAPMGSLMRAHYWIPAALSSQIVEDGAPLRVRLLGDDFVAFRAADGRVGFFDAHVVPLNMVVPAGDDDDTPVVDFYAAASVAPPTS